MTFYDWAMQKRITNTPRGDFLQDMREDERAKTVENTKEAWEANLRGWGACEGARVAFRSLWGSYQRLTEGDRLPTAGYVYFIQGGENVFKIGRTKQHPYKRMSGMQTGSPEDLELYGFIETPDPQVLESELHRRFAGCRRVGEWFSLTPATVAEVLVTHGGKVA